MSMKLTRALKQLAMAGCATIALSQGAVQAQKNNVEFNITSHDLAAALNAYGLQSNREVFFKEKELQGLPVQSLQGIYDPQDALQILLDVSGVQYRINKMGTILIGSAASIVKPGFQKISYNTTRDFEAVLSVSDADENVDAVDAFQLDEIIVTASRRSESLQDVGMSVRALGMEEIDTRGLQAMGDYLTSIPSVSYNEKGGGRNQITVRGISSGVSASGSDTTGYYFGEIPVSSTARGNPDLKLFDVERIEVLRGPQGTLYGSGSMGGAVRVIPAAAELDEVSGSFEGTLSTTSEGGTNYNVSGAVNLPLIDEKLAVRVVGYTYDNSGFVDNITSGGTAFGIADGEIDNVAGETTHGGRLSLRFQPTERLSIEAMVLIQDQNVSGLPEVTESDGKWKQNRWTPEDLNDDFQVYNLTVNYEGDGFDAVMAASYMDREWNQNRDLHSFPLLGATAPILLFDSNDEEIFVQEVRVSSNNDSSFQWLFGGYHSKKNLNFTNNLSWFGSAESLAGFIPGLAPHEPMHSRDNDISDEQYALFGEVSYHITDRLKATAGLRWFEYETDQDLEVFGIFQNETTLLNTSASTFTPKFALNFEATENQLYYASATKGFRPGGASRPLPDACTGDLNELGFSEQPDGTTPDSLWSYEVGAKLNMADGRVALSAAGFYIDWTNIPAGILLPCGFSFGFNADSASSKGMEMEVAIQAAENLRLDIGGSYTDAELDASYNPISGVLRNEGGRTPGVPKVTFTVGAQYDFTVADWNSLIRMDTHYVGDYSNQLPGDAARQKSGDYTVVNLRWSTDFDGWSVELFANNLFDETIDIIVDTEMIDNRTYRGRPRTIGARLRHNF